MIDRFKFRVFDLREKKYLDISTYIAQDGKLVDKTLEEDWFDGGYVREMATGLKDKNGNLIYENDYVKGRDVYHKVCWDDKKARFIIQNMKYKEYCCGIDQEFIDEIGLEIIGNIHEMEDKNDIL